jgi:multiple sugar transport system permease protein
MPRSLRSKALRYVLIYAWLLAIGLFAAFPFVWSLTGSLKERPEILTRTPTLLPAHPTLANYEFVLGETPAVRYFLNSVIVAAGTTLAALVLGISGAYALSRFHFPARRSFAGWLLASQMFPGVLMLIPLFVVLVRFALIDSYAGLILLNSVGALPFAIWMLKGYFDSVPVELEDAALLDGATRAQALRQVFLPVAAPGVAAAALFAFTSAWQEFIFALTVMKDPAKYTLSVGINAFVGAGGTVVWGNIMATAVLIIVPGLIVFLLLQRYMISGLSAGAVKG